MDVLFPCNSQAARAPGWAHTEARGAQLPLGLPQGPEPVFSMGKLWPLALCWLILHPGHCSLTSQARLSLCSLDGSPKSVFMKKLCLSRH